MTEISNKVPQRNQLGLILIALSFAGILFVLALTRIDLLHRMQESEKAHETELEKLHGLGFDQGYVEAIIDSYIGSPTYRLTKGGNGQLKLWKRVDINPMYTKDVSKNLSNTHE